MRWFHAEPEVVSPEAALPGRAEPLRVPPTHVVDGSSMFPPFPVGSATAD